MTTRRERLRDCEALHEFEEHTGMRFSGTELDAIAEQAKVAGLSMCAYLERSLHTLQTVKAKLRGEGVTRH